MAATDIGFDLSAAKSAADRQIARKRIIALSVPVIILAYLVYVFFAFDVPGLADRARLDNAQILLADAYSHKTHVERDNRTNTVTVAIEGESKGRYAADAWPDWVAREGVSTVIQLPDAHIVRFDPDAVRFDIPGYGQLKIVQSQSGITVDAPAGDLPDWINASNSRVTITTPAGRLSVTKTRAEVFRYFFGWELFWFTLDSPFYGKSLGELTTLAFSGDQVRPGQSNIAAMASDFWNNAMWRHKDVAWAIFETVLMAFLGTMGAAIIALPLAFLAARNFAPGLATRFGVRRIFDFLRGVDSLIWTIVLSRAFGPGPLTGSLAILTTDIGTFGKLFSEALENVDNKQIEGVRSTGANTVQSYRFGVLPQVADRANSAVLSDNGNSVASRSDVSRVISEL